MRSQSSCLVASFAIALNGACAQWVKPPTSLKNATGYADVPVRYKEVPTGICELDPDVRSFAGYADVSEHEHMHFWFFEARGGIDPKTAPLTVWINGGPGSSSMIGLFEELGPCRVDPDGNVYSNPYSWSNASNLLFVDQPSQVGFSYSRPVPGFVSDEGDLNVLPNNICPIFAPDGSCGTYSDPNKTMTVNSTAAAAPGFWKTLQGFMGVFPQYSRHGFHFATESYGGHYGPVFNAYIEEQNAKNISGAKEIKLETVLIGNGWYDPMVGYEAFYNFTVSPGNTYDYRPFNSSTEEQLHTAMWGEGGCAEKLRASCAGPAGSSDKACGAADEWCAVNVESVLDIVANRDEYDIRELMRDPFPYGFWVDYLNRADVQEAVGAFTNFTSSSAAVSNSFASTGDDGREAGTVEALRSLIDDYGLTVAMYAGDADYNCNWLGNEVIAGRVGTNAGWADAGYTDLLIPQDLATAEGSGTYLLAAETDDDSSGDTVLPRALPLVAAHVRQAGKFSFTRVFESGHEVPFYQPAAALTLFERAIHGVDVATGASSPGKEFRTVGKNQSADVYREGNSTVQWDVTPKNRTYDTAAGMPGAPWPSAGDKKKKKKKEEKQQKKDEKKSSNDGDYSPATMAYKDRIARSRRRLLNRSSDSGFARWR